MGSRYSLPTTYSKEDKDEKSTAAPQPTFNVTPSVGAMAGFGFAIPLKAPQNSKATSVKQDTFARRSFESVGTIDQCKEEIQKLSNANFKNEK